MKPAPFDYVAPASIAEAVDVMAARGADAAVLAGGQSLLIELRYRDRRPALLVDVNRIGALAGITYGQATVHLGALVRHAELERALFADPLADLFREIAPYVAHPPVRARGTFAGSLAWAHPASEWCALALALDAEIQLAGASGVRRVPAAAWFRGPFSTARHPDELVTGVLLQRLATGTSVAFAEHRRTHGSFAMAAAVIALRLAGERIAWARVGLANAAEVPIRARAAERVLIGRRPSPELVAEAGERAAAEADPVPEPHASPAYRRQVVATLVRRGLTTAIGRAVQPCGSN